MDTIVEAVGEVSIDRTLTVALVYVSDVKTPRGYLQGHVYVLPMPIGSVTLGDPTSPNGWVTGSLGTYLSELARTADRLERSGEEELAEEIYTQLRGFAKFVCDEFDDLMDRSRRRGGVR